jgi:phospholipid/cholesterol/gamma-HCH transport system substrate-binding protein
VSGFLDKRTRGDLIKLVIFLVVTGLATMALAVVIGNINFQRSHTYHAIFSDATGLVGGDDVRIAGVQVGSVKSIQIVDRTKAEVTFTVQADTELTQSSTATIRYRNLVGQRYVSVTQGVGNLAPLQAGGTIPESHTAPALDLTVLFNGFKPLFAALSPADINQLSYEIVQVFQGEGGNLQSLLQSTGSITNTLADRDQLIGDVIDNLNSVLQTVGSRDGELSSLISRLNTFVTGLTQDKDAILSSLDSVSNLADQTAQITTGIRPGLVSDIKELRQVASNLNQGRDEIDRALQILPIKLQKIGRTAIYGSFFNFYLCEFRAKVVLPTGNIEVPYETYPGGNGRCNLS